MCIRDRNNVIQVVASDIESDNFTFTLPSGMDDNNFFTINPTTGEITFNASPDFENPGGMTNDGNFSLNVFVTDVHGDTSIQPILITLANVAEAPVAQDDHYDAINEQGTLVFDVTANDTDVDSDFIKSQSSVTIINGPAHGMAEVNANGDIVYVLSLIHI